MILTWLQGIAFFGAGLCTLTYFTQAAVPKKLKHVQSVYSKPSIWYPLKFAIFYIILTLRSFFSSGKKSSAAGYGKKSRGSEKEMESIQPLSSHELAIDASYFNAYNKDGWYLGSGMQRRHKLRCEAVMILRVPQLGPDCLQWPWSPANDVMLVNNNEWATQQGSRFIMIEPMKKWRVLFDGKLKQRNNNQLRHVKYDLIWEASSPLFDMDTDMSALATCKAIAMEPWSRDFFDRLKSAHQTHYEIYGHLYGKFEIEGVDNLPEVVHFRSMKDRSYGGYRNWADFHRYILQYFATEQDTYLACHLVSLPVTMSHLVVGFVMDNKGNKSPIDWSSVHLSEIGEDGIFPKHYEFSVIAGGKRYNVVVDWVDDVLTYCGFNWECKLHSVFCKCIINGEIGQGMLEFEYKNTQGRKKKGASDIEYSEN